MDETYQHAFQWLIKQFAISDKKDLESAANAILNAQKKFPIYYCTSPANDVDKIKKEIFEAECLAQYLDG